MTIQTLLRMRRRELLDLAVELGWILGAEDCSRDELIWGVWLLVCEKQGGDAA